MENSSLNCVAQGVLKKIFKHTNQWSFIIQGSGYKERYKVWMPMEYYDAFVLKYPIGAYLEVEGTGRLDYFLVKEKNKVCVELNITPIRITQVENLAWINTKPIVLESALK